MARPSRHSASPQAAAQVSEFPRALAAVLRFQFGQHRFGARNHRCGKTCEFRHLNAVGAVGRRRSLAQLGAARCARSVMLGTLSPAPGPLAHGASAQGLELVG